MFQHVAYAHYCKINVLTTKTALLSHQYLWKYYTKLLRRNIGNKDQFSKSIKKTSRNKYIKYPIVSLPGVAWKGADEVPVCDLVDLHVAVVRGREEPLWVGWEGEAADGHGVTLKLVHQLRCLGVEHVDDTVDGSTGDVLSVWTGRLNMKGGLTFKKYSQLRHFGPPLLAPAPRGTHRVLN